MRFDERHCHALPAIMFVIDALRNVAGFWISRGFYAFIRLMTKA